MLLFISILPGAAGAQEQPLAVNFVPVTETLDTAGQPDASQLGTLAARGYGMVVNLAPPASRGSVATEGKLVAEGGIAYVNIPVDWQNPEYSDFELFSGVLDQSAGRKVLVHCQMNMRASMFTFLYRVTHQGVMPDDAFRSVRAVWLPQDQWLAFGKMVLNKHNIDFEFPAE